MTIEQMQNEIIKRYGFEHKRTIQFFRLCESDTSLNKIESTYKRFMAWPLTLKSGRFTKVKHSPGCVYPGALA